MSLDVFHVLTKVRVLSSGGWTSWENTTVTRTITPDEDRPRADDRRAAARRDSDTVTSDDEGDFAFPEVNAGNAPFTVSVTDGTDTDVQSFPGAARGLDGTIIVFSGRTARPNTPVYLHVHYETADRLTGRYTYTKPSDRHGRFRFVLPDGVHFPDGIFTFAVIYDDVVWVKRMLLTDRHAAARGEAAGAAAPPATA